VGVQGADRFLQAGPHQQPRLAEGTEELAAQALWGVRQHGSSGGEAAL
jgi:hypothetical protein